jgi:hypothetical protein
MHLEEERKMIKTICCICFFIACVWTSEIISADFYSDFMKSLDMDFIMIIKEHEGYKIKGV